MRILERTIHIAKMRHLDEVSTELQMLDHRRNIFGTQEDVISIHRENSKASSTELDKQNEDKRVARSDLHFHKVDEFI